MSEYFNKRAQDRDADDMVTKLSSAIGSSILEHVSLNDQMDELEYGAGPGLLRTHVAPLGTNTIPVDPSQEMLNKLLSKPELHGKVEAVQQNILDQPIEKKFDLIMSAMAVHHVEDTSKLIKRFAEHLRPQAMIALADLDKEDGSFHPEEAEGVFHSGFEREEFQRILESHGFENINFFTAHTVNKENREYPVFLVIASKS